MHEPMHEPMPEGYEGTSDIIMPVSLVGLYLVAVLQTVVVMSS